METVIYTHDEKGHRVDVHRPSAINPGDYEYIRVDEARKARAEDSTKLAGPGGTCHHCGKAIVWRVWFKHVPTGNLVTFGYICAGILEMTDNRIDHEMVLLKRAAANEREQWLRDKTKQDRYETFKTQNPELVKFLDEFDEDNSFVNRIKWGIQTYGSPLDNQIDSLKRFIAGREKLIEKKMADYELLKTAPVLTEGRQHIVGTVLSDKYIQTQNFGTQHKMLVQLDNGNKVFGSVPNSIYLEVGSEVKGKRVEFDAKIDPREDHFGWFSRPTKAKVV